MATKTAVIQFHRETAECWRAKGRPLFADAHETRAELLRANFPLTRYEEEGNELGIAAEIAKAAVA